jgi:hypothetical protein
MDLPGNIRVVHAVSVGSAKQVHYTYDMDKGMIVQVWRGDFLDATPMWYGRGDGSSRPVGAVQYFGKPIFAVAKLPDLQTNWPMDTTGRNFRPKGYVLDSHGQPQFCYFTYGVKVTDVTTVLPNGQGINREIRLEEASDNLYFRLAEGNSMEKISKKLYLVDNKSYYIRLEDTNGAKPVVRNVDGRKELIVPIRKNLSYTILF